MTGIAGAHRLMMAYAAGIRISFVGLVIEGYKIHPGFRLNNIFVDFHQNRIWLIALHPGNIGQFFDVSLLLRIMTAAAVYRACFFTGCNGFPVAFQTTDMRSLSKGDPVILSHILMAIAAGTFLLFGVKQFFSLSVIFVMANFAFIFCGFGMTGMQGFIKTDGFSNRVIL